MNEYATTRQLFTAATLTSRFTIRLAPLLVIAITACSGGGGSGPGQAATYTIGGNLSGLDTGEGVVLRNNEGDDLALSANGVFTFATALASGVGYNVTVLTPPAGKSCAVNNSSGTVNGANVTDVTVTCATDAYTIGGTVSGLAVGKSVVLQNNGGDDLAISANGSFTFPAAVANAAGYDVSVLAQPAGQTCAVNNGKGTVNGSNVTNVAVVCAANNDTYTIGGTVSGLAAGNNVVLQNNGSNDVVVIANGAFTFSNSLAAGASYNVTVLTQPTNQTCAVKDGAGTVAGNVGDIAVMCVAPRFVYAVSSTENIVSVFRITDPTDGKLTRIGRAATGSVPQSLAIHPSGKHAYVVNRNGDSVSQYTVRANGTLAPMATPMVAAGSQPTFIAIDPSGEYAYVVNINGNSVSQYNVGTDGALTPMNTPTVSAGSGPRSIAIDPAGKYVYVANSGGNTVSQYAIGTDGALAPMSTQTAPAGAAPYSIAIDPSGKYAYVANYTSNNVSQYAIGGTGALSAMGTASVNAGTNPFAIFIDPAGKYVYVSNRGSNDVSQYVIGNAGGLEFKATVAGGGLPNGGAVDPSGKYVYVANWSADSVSQYSIGTGGGLAPMNPATVASGAGPTHITVTGGAPLKPVGFAYVTTDGSSVAQYTIGTDGALTAGPATAAGFDPLGLAVHPSGQSAYVANWGNDNVSQYRVDDEGLLTPMNPATLKPQVAPIGPRSIAVDPSGRFAYMANAGSDNLLQYTIGADGRLAFMTALTIATGDSPASVVVHPSGQYVYVANAGATPSLSQYTIGNDGGLAPMTPALVAAGSSPQAVVVHPAGNSVYVADRDTHTVRQYFVGIDGKLTAMGTATVTAGTNPVAIAVDPSGKYAYAANYGGNNVSQYLIDNILGGLIPMEPPTVQAGTFPTSVSVDPLGKYVYVANGIGNDISQYSIGSDGKLVPLATPTVAVGAYPYSIHTFGTYQ